MIPTDQQGEALRAFQLYTHAFQALDARGAAAHFNEPAMFISPQGVEVLATRADVERMYEALMPRLREQGYGATQFSQLAERRLGDDLATVMGVAVWRKASGEEMRRFGMTYTLVRKSDTWRIVVGIVHEG